ncbi:Mlo-related protein [Parasponia andersonii]|uniref:MLO-like protein n=1 Tax=Parasponia andersonii TaxID=3476 RepID=A0A2P5D7J7_PARAD|nr:Mlo-related protein [Parasponia andersonii]
MAVGDASVISLEHTPTWALAVVCFFFISTSIFMEHSIHLLSNWLKRRKKTALHGAVEKLKSELMLLGFISLLLAVTQDYISKICIPANIADTMLPCRKQETSEKFQVVQDYQHFLDHDFVHKFSWRRVAEEDEVADSCTAKGKVALVTKEAIHQLHIFIFVLAVMQIVYSTITMALGRAKMKRWKAWERETQTTEYLVANDPNRFRFTRQTTFGRRHMNNCTETTVQLWIKCFFRQFFYSVAKVDYLTLRHGFIAAHLSARHNNFNFQQYIERSLEEDFRIVVGISPLMWFLVVILLLLDVYGWHVYSWLSYVPMLIVLVLGTKLEVIVARMALQIKEQNNVIIGTPLVKPNDNLFWFGKPRFVLTLLHYTLFVNAFELSFFIWVTFQFGLDSCYHVHTVILVTRVVLAVTVQVLCSYITLPLYALVTQMGSEFKSKVLEEQMKDIIKHWLAEVRERRKKLEQSVQYARPSLSAEWSPRLSNATVEVLPFLRNKSRRGEIMEEEDDEEQESIRRRGGQRHISGGE